MFEIAHRSILITAALKSCHLVISWLILVLTYIVFFIQLWIFQILGMTKLDILDVILYYDTLNPALAGLPCSGSRRGRGPLILLVEDGSSGSPLTSTDTSLLGEAGEPRYCFHVLSPHTTTWGEGESGLGIFCINHAFCFLVH